jgi:hypothetical protein
MSAMHRIRQFGRDDSGVSLVELSMSTLVGAILMIALSAFAISAMNAGTFTQAQSETLNNVRNTMGQIEKEVRGADSITWCAPTGSCLQIGAQTPTGAFKTIRYTHTGSILTREVYNTSSGSWGTTLTQIERVANSAAQKVFACDTSSTLLRVNVNLYIQPTPDSDPKLNIQNSIRPRNFPSVAACP